MEDLSGLLPGGRVGCLVPTSQAGGNQPAHSGDAQTAPGTPSPSINQDDVINPPFASALDHERTVLKDGHDTGMDGGKPMLRMGQWNDMRGSDA